MTRILPELTLLRHLDYPSRLRILNVSTLETRRMRADLLEVLKIINRLDSIFPSIFPAEFFIMEKEHGKTRGHPYKITKLHSRLHIRKYSFTQSQRIVNAWSRQGLE